jgi:uncharacterized protein (UPF0548 family)
MESERLDRLADRSLSYREVGATGVALPDGYRHFARDEMVGTGPDAFRAAAECLMTWGMHLGAGVRIEASAPRAVTGVNVLVGIGPTWLPIEAPCRVLHTIEQTDRVGFTYGTLEGHPVCGEESFSVLSGDDGAVRFVLIGFSRPDALIAKIGGPFGGVVQAKITDRYVAAIRAAVEAGTTI